MYVHVQTWGEVAGPSEERTGGNGGLGIEERSSSFFFCFFKIV